MKASGCTNATRPDTWPNPRLCTRPAFSGNFSPSRSVSRTQTKCAEYASSSSTQSRLRLGGITPSRRIWHSPIIWKTAAPPLACPVRLFCDTMNNGAPSERPIESASRSCSSVSLGSLANVEVSCLEITATSSAPTPSLASNRASGERRRVPPHRQHRQTHLEREGAAGQQDGAAALSFQEPEPSPVVGPGELRVRNAPAAHHAGVGGGGHVTEADDGLQRQVVEPTGDPQLGLADQ